MVKQREILKMYFESKTNAFKSFIEVNKIFYAFKSYWINNIFQNYWHVFYSICMEYYSISFKNICMCLHGREWTLTY